MKLTALAIPAILMCLLSFAALPAVNSMPLYMSMIGNQNYDHFGEKLAALDFNGDGYDDLAVLQSWWVPDSLNAILPINEYNLRNYGRILFYYGGPGFDDQPDFAIEGDHPWHFRNASRYISQLNDVNGDGYDDFGVIASPRQFEIYFGGAIPSPDPGYIIPLDTASLGGFGISALGDINGDGYDDFSYWNYPYGENPYPGTMYIVLGGSFTEIALDQMLYDNHPANQLDALGDINNDGYDDFSYSIRNQTFSGEVDHDKYIYYGSADLQLDDPYLLASDLQYAIPVSRDMGDVNGDGYDDFAGIMWSTIQVWYGSDELSLTSDLAMTPPYVGGGFDHSFVHGDLNGDGYEDVIGAEPIYGGGAGRGCLWLGGANMNGTADLYFSAVTGTQQFGLGVACGDFTGDGYDDIAFSEPCYLEQAASFPGKVRIYTGNAQLADTTVGVEDDLLPEPEAAWSFRSYPNPLRAPHSLSLKFSGEGYRDYPYLDLGIYNLKGQELYHSVLSTPSPDKSEITIPDLRLPRGVYLLKLGYQEQTLKTTKITIK